MKKYIFVLSLFCFLDTIFAGDSGDEYDGEFIVVELNPHSKQTSCSSLNVHSDDTKDSTKKSIKAERNDLEAAIQKNTSLQKNETQTPNTSSKEEPNQNTNKTRVQKLRTWASKLTKLINKKK